ncbi:MAG TPA: hypothetical protein VFJ43_00140, partial [Bacteroidia bacterium]|nr:hypothetical protein [Bacteroidia bacterium]
MKESSSVSPMDFAQWPSLSVSYLFFSKNNLPSVQLNFCFDKSPYVSGTEAAQKKAKTDIGIYLNIHDFLMSSENVNLSYCISIDGTAENTQGTKRTIDLTFFVEQLLNPIIGFLKNCADPEKPTVLAPIPVPYVIESAIDPASIVSYTDLFQLNAQLIIADENASSATFIFPQHSDLP